MDTALAKAQWAVGKALAPFVDGVLEAWAAGSNLGLDIEDLRTELLLVQATLETASWKQLDKTGMAELLQKLRDSVHSADDLLDELDYFRIQDQLHGTYDAADQHAKGGGHDLILNARHTAKAVGKVACLLLCWSAANPGDPRGKGAREQVSCCAWPAKHKAHGNSSSAPSSNQSDEEVRGCMPKLSKLLPCSSSPYVHGEEEKPKLRFNRVHVSERMKCIVEELQLMHRAVNNILQSCGPNTVRSIAQSRQITTSRSIEPKLYGRDHIVNSIIYDMIKGKYYSEELFVLPIVGPGGIGKTALVQHIYANQEVQNHFHVRIWVYVSVSFDFDLNELLEEIKRCIPGVEGEKEGTTEGLIAQRLKSGRFLLVLDDLWNCGSEDDWKRLLRPLRQSEQKGSMILVTTRFQAIAQMVKTTNHTIQLGGLEPEEFRKLFFTFVFGDEQYTRDHSVLLETGGEIMNKLKGFPVAAKTVGRLLRNDLSLHHWRRVLESKEWEGQTGFNDIMPALKLSYDYLPFHEQQCFSYSALFPKDHKYSSRQLINLWIGLDILQPCGANQRLEDIGLSNLKNLVTHGFFREEETDGHLHYVMHDLLHDLALKLTSHECLTIHCSDVGSVEIGRSIRHLSIIIDDVDGGAAVSHANFKSQLRKLRARWKVESLHTLMVFGKMDVSFASILGDLFKEAKALRIVHLIDMPCPVQSVLPNFSKLIHLRYLCLGTKDGTQMHLPHAIYRFYHLRILDLGSWQGHCDFPKGMSNLAKLRRFFTSSDELHSDIHEVGKLELLEELKVFRVKKENKGFEPKQLENLTELRELGIYNLENIHTQEEAAEAKLINKQYLERLTLDWYSGRSNTQPDVEAVVLESLRPHKNLQVLQIRGHKGPSCPAWLGDDLVVVALQSLHLAGVSWKVLPSFGKMRKLELVGLGSFEKWVPSREAHVFPVLQVLIIRDCPKFLGFSFSNHNKPQDQDYQDVDSFPKLQELEIENCPELLSVSFIQWDGALSSVKIRDIKLLEKLVYSKSSDGAQLKIIGKDDLHSLDQVLAFNNLTELGQLILEKCPPLDLEHLLKLASLKTLIANSLGGQGDVKWQISVEHTEVLKLCGNTMKELKKFLPDIARLSELEIRKCITLLAVGVDLQQKTSAASEVEEDEVVAAATTTELSVEQEKEEDGVLLLPARVFDSLQELVISHCPEVVLVVPDGGHNKTGGGLQVLTSLQRLKLEETPKFLSAHLFSSTSYRLFPSSLQHLCLVGVKGMGTLEPLSNLTSLTRLELRYCGEDLSCEGLQLLLTTGGQLRELEVIGSPRFFAGWNPKLRQVLQDGGGQEQLQLVSSRNSSTLRELWTDGLLAAPICRLLSSSLTQLVLVGTKEMEHFSKDQEDALHLLASLEELDFWGFDKLQHLPAGLHKLTNLKQLEVGWCPAIRSLPMDGLPKSLKRLNVGFCDNAELQQQCSSHPTSDYKLTKASALEFLCTFV